MIIKQVPEDFYVEEIIKLKPKKTGAHTYFWLKKTNWTTMRAVQQIARRCRATKRRFKFAGTKDKFAITKQAVSAFKIEPEILEDIRLKDIEIEIIGKGDEQISLGDLEGNKFVIIVRDLAAKDLKDFAKRVKETKKGFKNYFGPQRFGRGNTHLIGKEIIKGRLEEAVKLIITFRSEGETPDAADAREFALKNWGKWKEILLVFPKFLGIEKAILNWLIKQPNDFAGALRELPKPIRKIYIHAYQSWIFNEALKRVKAPKGELPIPGTDTKLGRDKFSVEIKKILKKETVDLAEFRCARIPEIGSTGTVRLAFVKPNKFKAGKSLKDELNKGKIKIKLQFELPKGVYATTLLEALFGKD